MSFFDFDELTDQLADNPWDEKPVKPEVFLYEKEYMNLREDGVTLSDEQFLLFRKMTQIFNLETLIDLYGDYGRERFKDSAREVVACLGKGSGKDYVSTLAMAYVVYQLLCLKDPSKFFGRPSHDAIDLINIAINADQARRVFFNGFKRIIEKSPWFNTGGESNGGKKYNVTAIQFEFDKFINVYSGHSEREAFEGLNLIFAVLDEIAGFSTDNTSGREDGGKTAEAVYKMYKASIKSRYAEQGKLVLLSFPRYKGDFIDAKYHEVISDVDFESVTMSHTFVLNPELPEDHEGNSFTITWQHDIVTHYKVPNVFALRRATWEMNPLKNIDDYVDDFFTDPLDAIGRVAAQPPDAVSGFFRNHEKVDLFSNGSNHVDEQTGNWKPNMKPEAGVEYFIHIDLALKHDNCVLAMSHVDHWAKRNIGGNMTDALPWFKVDLVRIWKPGQARSVDFADVKSFITEILSHGYNVKLITLDRWRSEEMLVWLEDQGVESAVQSVLLPQYQDLLGIINEERAIAPHIELLRKEIKQLRLVGDKTSKIDHPRSGSKDVADAVCGSIYGALTHTVRGFEGDIEVYTAQDLRGQAQRDRLDKERPLVGVSERRAPEGADVPPDIAEFFANMQVIGGR